MVASEVLVLETANVSDDDDDDDDNITYLKRQSHYTRQEGTKGE